MRSSRGLLSGVGKLVSLLGFRNVGNLFAVAMRACACHAAPKAKAPATRAAAMCVPNGIITTTSTSATTLLR